MGLALGPLLGALACLPQTSPDQRESARSGGELESAPSCRASSDTTIALLEAPEPAACEFALELRGEGQLALVELLETTALTEAPPLAVGTAPEACGPGLELCQIAGIVDPALGPLLWLSLRGPESEMPTQVYLGWVADTRLGFAETWYGLPSVIDHTRIGPPWALAPFDCDGQLVLLPAPRLPEAAHEAAGETLLALAGQWSLDAEARAHPPSAPADRSAQSCRDLSF